MSAPTCYNLKTCSICGKSKEKTQFQKKSYCIGCTREGKLIERYGINLQQYQDLLDSQDGVCKICGNPPEEGNFLCVDHNHSCHPGERACALCVRGLLCSDCNRGLGFFKDNPELMIIASKYLKIQRSAINVNS